ncbi:MAG: glycosyltransferase family 2 protein [Nitrospirae bacterium]|nr:glycosyltransferase family 2 protein [Nitrospirota bacterium]
MQREKHGLSFIVPIYNEESGIIGTYNRLYETLGTLDMPWEIILVDDGSKDNTSELIKNLNEAVIIRHPVNIGYGNALKTGIKHAQYNWIGTVDADGTYPIEAIPELLREMGNGFDMVIASRLNTAMIDTAIKRIFRFIFKLLVNGIFRNEIEDPNSGLRIFTKSLVSVFLPFLCGTFSFTTSLTLLAVGMSYFVKYVPVQYCCRQGTSKVRHIRDSIKTLQYIIQGITFYNPIKFFLLLSLAMIVLVCIPAMAIAMLRMLTLSLYYMIFGTAVTLLIGLGVLGDIIRISAQQKHIN